MLGYEEKGYRPWDPATRKVVNSRDVMFNEVDKRWSIDPIDSPDDHNNDPDNDEGLLTDEDSTSEYDSAVSQADDDLLSTSTPTPSLAPPRSKRQTVPPARFKDYLVDAPQIRHTSQCAVNDVSDNYCDLQGRSDEEN